MEPFGRRARLPRPAALALAWALERSEPALQATREACAGDVRELYARGPLVPLALVLAAGDFHELAVATGVAGEVLDRAEQARHEAARRAMVAAAAARARTLGFAAYADAGLPLPRTSRQQWSAA